ncbi:MAG: Flp family type IVb pilin [Cohaesibacter sp.]|jgi:pilus assembly protein Flp/PilA|nr:Flp family type IVb pilin [Cohaesibacter sp.]
MSLFYKKFLRDEDGATSIEYVVIAAVLSVGLIAATTNLGTQLDATLVTIFTAISGAIS